MAEEIVAPGVTRQVSRFDGRLTYHGTLEALRAAGLIPDQCEYPGKPGTPGVRWTGPHGERWVLTKGPRCEMCLRRVSTRRQREMHEAQVAADHEVEMRLAAIENALEWTDGRNHFRFVLGSYIEEAFKKMKLFAFEDSPHRGPWTISPQDRERIDFARRACQSMLDDVEPTFDPAWRAALEHELELLRGDTRALDETAALAAGAVLIRAAQSRKGTDHA